MRLFLAVFLLLALPVRAKTDEDLGSTFEKLKQAEASRDVALVKVLAVDVYKMASDESAAVPQPPGESGDQYAEKYKAWLAEVRQRAEYALYATASTAKPEDTISLIDTLEGLNPRSRYMDSAYSVYFLALQKTGQAARIPTVAAAALKNFPDNEDALLVLADAAMAKKQTDRAAAYGERLVAVMARHPKPEGYPAADWNRKRDFAMGRARWISGVSHTEKQQYGEADKDLRAALPLVKSDPPILASTLFHLGLANYQIGATMLDKAKVLEAAAFCDQAAAIPGPLSQQAWRNAQAMRVQAQKLR